MKAARIHHFGPPEVIVLDDLPCPVPGPDEVLIRVVAAGVGPWDALIREHRSIIDIPLPLTLGSDISGIVEKAGTAVTRFKPGDKIYGATNLHFIGAYAEYALASASMIAIKPESLSFVEAASAPIVAVTAWQMLFDYAKAQAGQSVLIHGGAGNVGAYAVQVAHQAGLKVYATASAKDVVLVERLGADIAIDYTTTQFEDVVPPVDIVLDTVGGNTRQTSFKVVKPLGVLVSVVSRPSPGDHNPAGVQDVFFLVDVTSERLDQLTKRFDEGDLKSRVGTVLPLNEVRRAHEMLDGAPHESGKIVLQMPTVV